MKKILKLFSVFVLLISSFAFAQYDPDGCTQLPNPLKDKIKTQIPRDGLSNPEMSLRSNEIAEYLTSFDESYAKHSQTGTVSKDLIDIVMHSQETAYLEIPNELINRSTDFNDLRLNIELALKSERNVTVVESLILIHYQTQILESYGYDSRKGGWKCAFAIAVGTTIGGGVGAFQGGAVGAIYGAASGANLGYNLGCK